MKKCILFLILIELFLGEPFCEVGKNNCLSCNPLTKLCVKCDKEIYTPDENGGCKNLKKCIFGENNCLGCNEAENLCKECEEGYSPDEIGGCSYTTNCEVSYRGKCLKCKENFFLVGLNNSIQICKSYNSEDLSNCKNVNTENGKCEKCEEGYYLNAGDKKCIKTEHCYESTFGICRKCTSSYYLNKNEQKCIYQTSDFYNCRESLNGKECNLCNDNYFLAEDGRCTSSNYCSKADTFSCKECISGYYLSEDHICTTEENCSTGKKDVGVCLECKDGFAIDFKDGKCKSNKEDNELKFCKYADGDCKECLKWYYLGEDHKCSSSKNCSESDKGICLQCSDNYYLGLDNKCTDVNHCIYSDDHFKCVECEGEYCFNEAENKCFIGEGELKHCKFSYFGSWCSECKEDYYLNQTEFLCRSNLDPNYFYKCAKTHSGINMCSDCVKGYYLGYKDHKCSKIKGCERSEDENTCLECGNYYCLDLKTRKCENNYRIENEEKKFYYKCNMTNEEGTLCGTCLKGYTLNEKGLCSDLVHCEEEDENGNCLKCIDKDSDNYCLNKDFGCVDNFYGNCLECDNILDFDKCSKCAKNYTVNDKGKCIFG